MQKQFIIVENINNYEKLLNKTVNEIGLNMMLYKWEIYPSYLNKTWVMFYSNMTGKFVG